MSNLNLELINTVTQNLLMEKVKCPYCGKKTTRFDLRMFHESQHLIDFFIKRKQKKYAKTK